MTSSPVDEDEYANLFQSSGEEYRSDEDVYVDEEEEIKVSSAMAADVRRSRKSKLATQRKNPDGNGNTNVDRDSNALLSSQSQSQPQSPVGKIGGGRRGSGSEVQPKYADNFSDENDDPDREALLQSYIDQKLNESSSSCVRAVRVAVIAALLLMGVTAGLYFSSVGVNRLVDAAENSKLDVAPPAQVPTQHTKDPVSAAAKAASKKKSSTNLRPGAKLSGPPSKAGGSQRQDRTKKEIILQQRKKKNKEGSAGSASAKGSEHEQIANHAAGVAKAKESKEAAEGASPKRSNLAVAQLQFEVLDTYLHNMTDFSEGLEFHPTNGLLYECTGRRKRSGIKAYNVPNMLQPTQTKAGWGKLKKFQALGPQYFGEGCTIFKGKLFELTYKSKKGFVYDADTLHLLRTFDFSTTTGEGWGVTHDDEHIIMSDGSNKIFYWDPEKPGHAIKTVAVSGKIGGKNAWGLNELEYVKNCTAFPDRPVIFANVFPRTWVVVVDPVTGELLATIDFSTLAKRTKGMDVLNGIAYHEQSGNFYLTGKQWPRSYVVQITQQ